MLLVIRLTGGIFMRGRNPNFGFHVVRMCNINQRFLKNGGFLAIVEVFFIDVVNEVVVNGFH